MVSLKIKAKTVFLSSGWNQVNRFSGSGERAIMKFLSHEQRTQNHLGK
jgi:hypothetical protein